MSLFKKISEWNGERIEKNYQKIISQYSPEDQELIKKGRAVKMTFSSLDSLMEGNPDKKIIPLNESRVVYRKTRLGCRAYDCDVKYWLDLGRMGADALCSVFVWGEVVCYLTGFPLKRIGGGD